MRTSQLQECNPNHKAISKTSKRKSKSKPLRAKTKTTPGPKAIWRQCEVDSEHQWRNTKPVPTGEQEECPHCIRLAKMEASSLEVLCPEAASQWHPLLNGQLKPSQVTPNSIRLAWWQCSINKDHTWQAKVLNKSKFNIKVDCPECRPSGETLEKSLQFVFPELVKCWHVSKNAPFTPSTITYGSGRKCWWQCPNDSEHVFQLRVSAFKKHGCPLCPKPARLPQNSLAKANPELAKKWHPTLNGNLTPDAVGLKSNKVVWWQCPSNQEHVYQRDIVSCGDLKGNPCPYCPTIPANPLAIANPELAKEWHPTLNGSLTPDIVSISSRKRYWWQCPKVAKHSWQVGLNFRKENDNGCPYCRTNPRFPHRPHPPHLLREWDYKKNKTVTPEQINSKSKIAIWWQCENHPNHSWQARIRTRLAGGATCPICKKAARRSKISLAARFPSIAEEWHPIKNASLTANDVTSTASTKAYWQCRNNPRHEWLARVVTRTCAASGKCPHCYPRQKHSTPKVLADYPQIARQWNLEKNGGLTPEQITISDNRCVWWQCEKFPNHQWQSKISSRRAAKSPCPICQERNPKRMRSLADSFPEIAKEWHPTKNKALNPNTVASLSPQKAYWQCPNNPQHDWCSRISQRTLKGRKCPHCQRL